MSNLYDIVRKEVNDAWDPIGVAEFTDDEYDSYIPGLCEMLNRHASAKEVFEHLWKIETESMGLSGDRLATKRFAERLCTLRSPRN